MNADELIQQVETAYRHATALHQCTLESATIAEALEELHNALDQLRVISYQWHQHHEVVAAERERYFELFFEAPDGYLVTDENGTIREANRAAAMLLNTQPPFLLGEPLSRFIADEQHPAFHNQLKQLHQEEQLRERNVLLQPIDAAPFCAALRVNVVRKQEGTKLHVCMRDVADEVAIAIHQSQLYNQLAKSEQKFRQLAETIRDVFWMMDATTLEPIYISPAYEQIWGRTCETWYANPRSFGEAVHPDERELVSIAIDRYEQGEEVDIEYRIVQPTGKVRWIHDRAFFVRNESGEIYRFVGIASDITQRKQVEQERDRFFNLSLDMLTIGNLRGYFTHLNSAWERILGWTLEELQAKPIIEWIHPADREASHSAMKKVGAGFCVFEFENRYRCKDGSYKWLSWTAVPFLEEGLVYAIARDVSECKQTQAILQAQKDFLQIVIDTNPNKIFVKDQEGKYILTNQVTADDYGLTVADVLGKTDAQLNSNPAEVEQFVAQDQEVLTTLQQTFTPEAPCRTWTGEVHWYQVIKKPIFSKDGQVAGVFGVCTDITERKRAEEVQRQTQARLQRLVEANLIGVIFADFSGNITEANDAFLEMVGYTREELRLGKVRWLDMTPPEYAEDDAYAREQIRLTGACTPHEKEYIRKDGKRVPILTGSALLEGSDQDCVSFVLDLTWRKQAEAQIRESLREKEVLLQEIHHRVKNNLQVISSLLDLQAQTLKEPRMQAIFQDSCNRVKSMALVHENLYQSHNFAQVNFPKYLENLTRNLLQVYRVNTNFITLQTEIDEVSLSLETAIPCGLIINELVSNALKYAFPNQMKGTISITLQFEGGRNYLLTITDNGIGLPFNWENETPKSLGLQLVKVLAKQLNGTIQVNCHSGTTFRLRFSE